VLLAEAVQAGATILTDSEVINVETTVESQQTLLLKSGRRVVADVVIGADGMLDSMCFIFWFLGINTYWQDYGL
jgi:2-polyprenyl-6-methoxyphenol hydroxylase-like FAD-dependent oxidoreductase